MSQLKDIIQINATSNDAAIVLESSLGNQQLVQSFAPTQAAVKVLQHISKAVLPQATQEDRAINLFGNYGSGKSHLAVLMAQLLRDGSGSSEFEGLFQRLSNFGELKLAENLKNTFLARNDPDAKPYLLVSLYAAEAPSLADQLMEALYDALDRHADLNPQTILPMTEYEACVKCFEVIIHHSPEYAAADLSQWQLADDYLRTDEILKDLKAHQPIALDVFKRWYKAIYPGAAAFNPANEGGKNFIEAYQEAGKNLAEQYGYGGIVVVWDEFGDALENLLGNPLRHATEEIMGLQRFVETVCKPAQGHSVFITLTHVSFAEYATRMGVNETIKNRLEVISGRFKEPSFEISLSAFESEGYHLLGMQKGWTEQGQKFLEETQHAQQQLFESCIHLAIFKPLGQQLTQILTECYPLHPLMAAGVFALSDLAQSNRTALTFFGKDNKLFSLDYELNEQQLFSKELIRLPQLVDYYLDNLKEKKSKEWECYSRASAKIPVTLVKDEFDSKQAILKLLLLAELLGENFQTSELFLAAALYDAEPNTSATQSLGTDLEWLKAAGVVWKNDVTGQWTLTGDSGVDVEALINTKLTYFAGRSVETLLNDHPDMQDDLLPQLGLHELEPSECGIVRSYEVVLLSPPFSNQIKIETPLISAKVFLVLGKEAEDIETAKTRVLEIRADKLYFWLPSSGIRGESVTNNGKQFKLGGLLCRYLALEMLLKEKTATEELRRQLQAKWEKNRQDCLDVLQRLFGRESLENGQSQILKAGVPTALGCKTWHGLRQQLASDIQAMYPKEIPIRAMNLNVLNNGKYTGSSIILKIVERILAFDNNPDYQTDLLGEKKETSQPASLIDGVLGANQLFIKSAEGWKIKEVADTEGRAQEVLKLIHDTLLHKRDKPYLVSKELRAKLIAPPYGLPDCTLAMLAAVAIRHEVPRLRWGSTKETNFAKNLNAAFSEGSRLTIRLFDFTSKQTTVLNAVGLHFKLQKQDEKSNEEYASECCKTLRNFVNNQIEAVKNSGKLQEKTRQLVKFCQQIGANPQDLADCLIELLGAASDVNQYQQGLKAVLDDFEKITHAKQYEVKKTWEAVIPSASLSKQSLIDNLTHQSASTEAKALGDLLSEHEDSIEIDVNKVTEAVLNKPFEQCSDVEIGQCKGKIETLIEYHQQAKIDPPINSVNEHTAIIVAEEFIEALNQLLARTSLPALQIKAALNTVLNQYGDE
ncbi:MAG: hypothetical protein GQ529_08625 [Methyloprofundus sp.]|nr:hypothetical protein [Methyloprofundus sp.]